MNTPASRETPVDTPSDQPLSSSSGLVWESTIRRERFTSTEQHAPVVRACEEYLKAWILTGAAGDGCSPFPDWHKEWFSTKIKIAWLAIANELGPTPGVKAPGVKNEPEKLEARRVSKSTPLLPDIFLLIQ